MQGGQSRRPAKRAAHKVSCEECFFKVNLLCALELPEPCATFRPSEAELRQFALANAPPVQHPRRVFFIPELPLTGTNKIDRRALAEEARFRVSLPRPA